MDTKGRKGGVGRIGILGMIYTLLILCIKQIPPSMGFSRQEYWSGLPFPSSWDLPSKPRSPTLQADALTPEPPGKPIKQITNENKLALRHTRQHIGLLASLDVVIQRLWVQVPPESNFNSFSFTPIWIFLDFPGSSDSKVSAYNAGDLGSIPGLGSSPGEGNGNPLQYSSLKIPWTEEHGRLQSMGSQRVGHD